MNLKNQKVKLLVLLTTALGAIGGASWSGLQLLGGTKEPVTSEVKQNSPTVAINLSNANIEPPKALADVPGVPNGLFSNGGSTTWAAIRAAVNQPIATAWPNFQLRYTEPTTNLPGSRIGVEMLLNDQLSFAQSSQALTVEEFQGAVNRGFKLKQVPVAIDGLAIAVNPQLNVKGLTLSQLKDIYTGKITNWKEVGGPNLTIVPYTRSLETGGTLDFFQENVLQGEKFTEKIKIVRDTTQGLRSVSGAPGGIYYASASMVVPQCTVKALPIGRTLTSLVPPYQGSFVPESECPAKRNQINREAIKSGQYPITRRLFVIIKENGQIDEQAGNAYANLLLTEQGQNLIEQAGFIKIR
ncbi:MAG: substrate-binding domain-containing protein [Snowella sp.]|nr:substrate-binding domain-containing protein [Snowella sp.]